MVNNRSRIANLLRVLLPAIWVTSGVVVLGSGIYALVHRAAVAEAANYRDLYAVLLGSSSWGPTINVASWAGVVTYWTALSAWMVIRRKARAQAPRHLVIAWLTLHLAVIGYLVWSLFAASGGDPALGLGFVSGDTPIDDAVRRASLNLPALRNWLGLTLWIAFAAATARLWATVREHTQTSAPTGDD